MRFISALCLLSFVSAIVAQDIAPTNALSPEDERKSFKLPAGFEAQLVASEPAIEKPMQICWDAKGRLWVTTSHTYPFPAEASKASDKLFILSDFAADGKSKKIEVFDDKLNIPIGVLPLPDCKSVIVSSVGQILKLTDTDGDGKADKREVLFDGFGTRDTHGMVNSFTLMPDGWVYACHGYLNTSKVKGKDGHVVEMNSGNTFRFRPDGSRIEQYTHGQVNPFGMTVDPWGNLYTADCHTKPITQLIRGAYYDSFGKPHDGLGYAPHVTNHDHGSTALCGLAWYQADQFPKEYDSCMFLGNVVTNKINADKITWKGSTPVAQELPDFLVSGDPWFRPSDIKLGPDGALYVSDFYNKIIGHYEVDLHHPQRDKVHGRVWRIVYTKPVEKIAKTPVSPADIIDGIATEREINDADRVKLISRLGDSSRAARIAVDAMTVRPHTDYVSPLIRFLSSVDAGDSHLVHAAKIALRNSVAVSPITLKSKELDSENAKVRSVILPICLGLPISDAAKYLAKALVETDCTGVDRGLVAEHIAKHGGADEAKHFLAFLEKNKTNAGLIGSTTLGYLRGVRTIGKPMPEAINNMVLSWAKGSIDSNDRGTAMTGLTLLRELKPNDKATYEIVAGKLAKSNAPTDVKLAGCETAFALNAKESIDRLFPLCADANEPIALREKVASLASGVRDQSCVIKLKDAIKAAPYRLAVVLSSGVASDRFGADLLFAAVKAGEAPARVLQERVVQDRLKAAKIPDWEAKVSELTKGIPATDARLNALIRDRAVSFSRAKTDVAKGKELYAKSCAACHQLAGQGGKVGPNLDGMGIRGVDRLLEDILDPNRNVDIAFRATILNLADGRVISGLLLREEGAVLVMADNEGKELRFNKSDVEKRTQSNTSPMPADWGEKLKPDELHDLLAFVLTQKAKETTPK